MEIFQNGTSYLVCHGLHTQPTLGIASIYFHPLLIERWEGTERTEKLRSLEVPPGGKFCGFLVAFCVREKKEKYPNEGLQKEVSLKLQGDRSVLGGDQTRFLCLSYNFSLLLWKWWWKGRCKAVYLPFRKLQSPGHQIQMAWMHMSTSTWVASSQHQKSFLHGFLVVKRMINHQQLESPNLICVAWESTKTKKQKPRGKKDGESRNLCAFGVQEATSFCIGITNLSISPQWWELLIWIYPPSKARSTCIKDGS